MATPLARLVHDVLHDPEVRAQFAASPESFLVDHGHDHLDAADLREAFFVLADGSAPDDASDYRTGGRAMGDDDLDGGSATAGLSGALAAIFGSVVDVDLGADPTSLDDVADEADDEADDHALDAIDDAIDDADSHDDDGADAGPAGTVLADEFDLLDGLPDLDRSGFTDETLVRDVEPNIDDGDGWDDLI